MAPLWRLFWLLVLAIHAVTAAAWWWLSPGGFPPAHPRFWINRVVPVAILAIVAMAVFASRRRRLDRLCPILLAFPAVWGASALMARVVFPVTFRILFLPPLFGALLMGLAAFLTFRRHGQARGRLLVAAAAVAFVIGSVLPLSLRAPPADTQPLNAALPAMAHEPATSAGLPSGWPGGRLMVHPGDGSLTFNAGALRLTLQPLLTFISRSPDGCWTCLAPRALRNGPGLGLTSTLTREGRLTLQYRSDYDAMLHIEPDPENGPVHLEAWAVLPRPIDSHLNSFCDIAVWGHRRLSLSFSPCPDAVIDVRAADYPVGRPLRVAFRDDRDGFHVVEASSGEKGPFHELARGRLTRSEPLAITLHDDGQALVRVVLDDWSAQTGTDLSPTAGWGLPVNAIEFQLEGDTPRSPAAIYFTLAGTSVGRGWDSVGHRAGTYRNRIRIERLEKEVTESPSP